jgi:hypothetical protein
MSPQIPKLIAVALLGASSLLLAAERTSPATPKDPASLKGSLAAGKEESWTVVFKGGKEARLLLLKGKRGVVVDIYDPQNLAANEGVSEADWFPVGPGPYKVTVTNVTKLGGKSAGQDVAYEVRIEVK